MVVMRILLLNLEATSSSFNSSLCMQNVKSCDDDDATSIIWDFNLSNSPIAMAHERDQK